MVLGHFLGNGIYSIFCCAFGAIALTYVIGAWLGGRLCGCLAALFLITNYGFWEYSQKIMSEVPSVFLATAVLALLLASRGRKRPALMWLAAGSVLGLAITVRHDNILLLAPSLLLLPWEDTWRERMRRAGSFAVGLAPFIITVVVYQQVTFGSPWRTGYHYWGTAENGNQPLFSAQYITKTGFMHLRQVEPGRAGIIDGNGAFYAKSLLAEADTSRIFGHPIYWQLPSRRLYQMLAPFRTALGVVGLLACLVGWRTNTLRRQFLLWLVVSTVTSVVFYLVYNWQEERFLLRLVPLFCLVDAIGVRVLLALWPAKAVRATVIILVSALIFKLARINSQAGFPTGNSAGLYTTLSYCAQQMESNAVVVSNFDPLRVDAYMIRGTDRIAVPLGRSSGIHLFVGSDVSPTSFCPFVASEDPARLRELVHSGTAGVLGHRGSVDKKAVGRTRTAATVVPPEGSGGRRRQRRNQGPVLWPDRRTDGTTLNVTPMKSCVRPGFAKPPSSKSGPVCFNSSMMNCAAANASPRCAASTRTSNDGSPTAITPRRWMTRIRFSGHCWCVSARSLRNWWSAISR